MNYQELRLHRSDEGDSVFGNPTLLGTFEKDREGVVYFFAVRKDTGGYCVIEFYDAKEPAETNLDLDWIEKNMGKDIKMRIRSDQDFIHAKVIDTNEEFLFKKKN